jgi:pSer/pThr/pTyr-binding forkhead associated (FHA) protein
METELTHLERSDAVGADNETSDPCLFFRDGAGRQQMTILPSAAARLTIGRGLGSDLHLPWDNQVSGLHAQLEHVGSDWVLVDDGLSRNGTYVNGERLIARHRLRDGDVILVGSTTLSFRADRIPPSPETRIAQNVVTVLSLSPTQRQVIQALCRPYTAGAPYATPATNQQIADEIFLSVDSVKNHLRTLFGKFGVEDLPQNQKRARLVELAFTSGLVSERNG